MRTHINRATGSSISMDEMRTRYGGSGAISFSDLYKTEGFTITCGVFTSKFFSYNGYYHASGVGSVSPAEVSSHLQFAANSYLELMYAITSTPANTQVSLSSDAAANGQGITTGFKGTDITRIVTANTSRTVTASANASLSFTYTMPGTGTIHCLVKF